MEERRKHFSLGCSGGKTFALKIIVLIHKHACQVVTRDGISSLLRHFVVKREASLDVNLHGAALKSLGINQDLYHLFQAGSMTLLLTLPQTRGNGLYSR